MIKQIIIVLIVLIIGYSQNAMATSTTVSNQITCEGIGGTWTDSTCTVGTVTIIPADTLIISSGINLNIGTLTSSGTVTNHGIINIAVGGVITTSGTFTNNGIINNNDTITTSAPFTNNGSIKNQGLITNSNTITNNGSICGGTVTNSGTISPNAVIAECKDKDKKDKDKNDNDTDIISTDTTGRSFDNIPPSIIITFDYTDYPVIINDISYTAKQLNSPVSTKIIKIGEPVKIKLLLYDNEGYQNIIHVEMYVNKHNNRVLNDMSETAIIWDKYKDVTIMNPDGLISNGVVKQTIQGDKALFTFDVTFAKEFNQSDVLFISWDKDRNGMKVQVIDAIEVDFHWCEK